MEPGVPEKQRDYSWVKFRPETLRQVLKHVEAAAGALTPPAGHRREVVTSGGETWSLDTDDEFYAEYRRDSTNEAIYYALITGGLEASFIMTFHRYGYGGPTTHVGIRAPQRYQVEAAYEILDESAVQDAIPRPEPVVFIGHGRSGQWRLLEEHLRAHHGVKTEAYESDVRAGRTITEVLMEMGQRASLALLVHTAEDEAPDGGLQARANVIHETGYFQGLLGSNRAIILREDGCGDFSNVHGMQEIRYSAGNIRETFGEVVGILRREFWKAR